MDRFFQVVAHDRPVQGERTAVAFERYVFKASIGDLDRDDHGARL